MRFSTFQLLFILDVHAHEAHGGQFDVGERQKWTKIQLCNCSPAGGHLGEHRLSPALMHIHLYPPLFFLVTFPICYPFNKRYTVHERVLHSMSTLL